MKEIHLCPKRGIILTAVTCLCCPDCLPPGERVDGKMCKDEIIRLEEDKIGKENFKKTFRQIQELCTKRRVEMLTEIPEPNFRNVYGPFSRVKEQEE